MPSWNWEGFLVGKISDDSCDKFMDKGDIPEHFRQRIREAKEKQLEELDLSNHYGTDDKDKLIKVPPEVFELTHLKVLKLSNNTISELPDFIDKLTNLEKLYLDFNSLSRLPNSLGKLTSLKALYLGSNSILKLPNSLGNLTGLVKVNLNNNSLSKLPNSLGNLTGLKELYLGGNSLSKLPNSLERLTSLKSLNLRSNRLLELPEYLSNLANLKHLDLRDNNELIKPPYEVAFQGIEAVKYYFWQLKKEGADYIYEAKLLIVGEAGAGKTTLAKKINNPDYKLKKKEKSTEGIDFIQWSFPVSDKKQTGQNFKVNIWDFGGQEIYHATHQFFLTKRSLYALVADTRKEDTDFYYWLNVVELLSDNSPVLIIKNEKQERQREINKTALRGQFTNLEKILATNLANNRGLDEVLSNIKYYIQKLPHIGDTLPKTWVKVRQNLEQDDRNYISLQEYLCICENHGFTNREYKLQLSRYLHDLGVCLHFQDEEDSVLYRTVILKPEWGTDAVYKVLDDKQVFNNQGHFTRDDLKTIWHEEKYVDRRGELLELMKKFQLCYQIPGDRNAFIAPQLLSDNQPEYEWDDSKNLVLRYAYPDFMPKGIITRFIVAMHQYIDQQKYVWKSGVILSNESAKAEVIEYYGKREIRVRVTGNNKKKLMTIVAYELDKISDSYNKRLNYHKLIPCNCKQCSVSQTPYFYELNKLEERIRNQKVKIECGNPPYIYVEVLSLIDDIFSYTIQESKDDSFSLVSLSPTGELTSIEINIPISIESEMTVGDNIN